MITDAGLYRLLYSARSDQAKEIRRQLFLIMNPTFLEPVCKPTNRDDDSSSDDDLDKFDPQKKLEFAINSLHVK